MAKSLEELELDLQAVTSRLTVIDEIVKAAKIGRTMEMVFRCNHSGLHLPSDYIKGWGIDYGIGLGPDPVSEVLDTEYEIAPPEITGAIRDISQIMHPVRICRVQVDLALVDVDELDWAVCAKDDPFMARRAQIVRGRQLVNKRGRLRVMQAAWERK